MALRDLLNMFAIVFQGKLRERPTRHQLPGKHGGYHKACKRKGHRGSGGERNPGGTKLVRRFIRRGNTENVAMRKLYAELTGHQYGDAA